MKAFPLRAERKRGNLPEPLLFNNVLEILTCREKGIKKKRNKDWEV